MLNTVLEAAGLVLIAAAVACLAVVAWSVSWQAGLSVCAVAGVLAGTVLIVLANRRPSGGSA